MPSDLPDLALIAEPSAITGRMARLRLAPRRFGETQEQANAREAAEEEAGERPSSLRAGRMWAHWSLCVHGEVTEPEAMREALQARADELQWRAEAIGQRRGRNVTSPRRRQRSLQQPRRSPSRDTACFPWVRVTGSVVVASPAAAPATTPFCLPRSSHYKGAGAPTTRCRHRRLCATLPVADLASPAAFSAHRGHRLGCPPVVAAPSPLRRS